MAYWACAIHSDLDDRCGPLETDRRRPESGIGERSENDRDEKSYDGVLG
jgi:hypothetical protein